MEEATGFLLFIIRLRNIMIDKAKLHTAVEDAIKGKDVFVTDITVSQDNDIVVEIDSMDGVDLDTCADITRKIEEGLPSRDEEDYSLEVGSAGITSPFKVVAQYTKNLGKEVEVLTKDGRKVTGVLTGVDGDTSMFTVSVPTKGKEPGAKRPVIRDIAEQFKMSDCKHVKHVFRFK